MLESSFYNIFPKGDPYDFVSSRPYLWISPCQPFVWALPGWVVINRFECQALPAAEILPYHLSFTAGPGKRTQLMAFQSKWPWSQVQHMTCWKGWWIYEFTLGLGVRPNGEGRGKPFLVVECEVKVMAEKKRTSQQDANGKVRRDCWLGVSRWALRNLSAEGRVLAVVVLCCLLLSLSLGLR